jgi:hypothetical protein
MPAARNTALQDTTVVEEKTLERIVDGLNGLRFGTLEIVVHNSKIVRITRSEKLRLDDPAAPPLKSPPED